MAMKTTPDERPVAEVLVELVDRALWELEVASESTESSPASFAAFKRMMADPCWRKK